MNFNTKDYFELDNKRLINLALLLILVLSIAFLVSSYSSRGIRINDRKNTVREFQINPFENIYIEARVAIVYDLKNSNIIFSKNSDESLPLASIAKVLSAVTAIDLLPEGTIVSVDRVFLSEEGDSGLFGNERWKLTDLIDFSLISSSNDGIAAIAGAAGALNSKNENLEINHKEFIEKMNVKAQEIGMLQSHFNNVTGLDINETLSGGYSSAKDVALLFGYVLRSHPEIFEATRYESLKVESQSNISHKAENTNTDIRNIPGLIASKTGFTDLANGNLAIAFDPGVGRPIVVVVLGSSANGRFNDVKLLTNTTLEYLSQGH